MKIKKIFEDALDYCKLKEQKIRDEKLLQIPNDIDVKSIWKNVNSRKPYKPAPADYFDDAFSDQTLPNRFAMIFSGVTSTLDESDFSREVYFERDKFRSLFSYDD